MSFSQRLKQLRKEHKLTQYDLGQKINVTKVSVSGYENGIRTPDIETLTKLADVFDVSIDYLLNRSDNKNESMSEKKEIITEKLPIFHKIFFDSFLDATEEEQEKMVRYWHEEVNRRKKLPPPKKDKDETPSAWELKDK